MGTQSDLWCQLRLGSRLSRGILSCCKGYCGRADAERNVEQNVVLARDPKRIRLLCNTNLGTNIPSRGFKEERIRIHLQVRPNIQNNGYKR